MYGWSSEWCCWIQEKIDLFLVPSKVFGSRQFAVTVKHTFIICLPVIVGGHGSDWLRDGLVHVVETGRLDGRQPVVVATATHATSADRVRRGAGRRTYGRRWWRMRGWRTVLLFETSASSSTSAAPALVSQFLFASPLCSAIAKPHLHDTNIIWKFQFEFRRVVPMYIQFYTSIWKQYRNLHASMLGFRGVTRGEGRGSRSFFFF